MVYYTKKQVEAAVSNISDMILRKRAMELENAKIICDMICVWIHDEEGERCTKKYDNAYNFFWKKIYNMASELHISKKNDLIRKAIYSGALIRSHRYADTSDSKLGVREQEWKSWTKGIKGLLNINIFDKGILINCDTRMQNQMDFGIDIYGLISLLESQSPLFKGDFDEIVRMHGSEEEVVFPIIYEACIISLITYNGIDD